MSFSTSFVARTKQEALARIQNETGNSWFPKSVIDFVSVAIENLQDDPKMIGIEVQAYGHLVDKNPGSSQVSNATINVKPLVVYGS